MTRIRLVMDAGADEALPGFADAWGWQSDECESDVGDPMLLGAWRSTREPAAIRYRIDPRLNLRVLEVTGEGAEDVASWVRLLVPSRAREDLSGLITQLADPPSWVELMHLAAALGNPDKLDPELFLILANGLIHFDARVRQAAVLATAYLPWPRFRTALKRLAETDPDPDVRARAAERLTAF
jgi:hypothetical protein